MRGRLSRLNWLAWSVLVCGLAVSFLSWRYLQQQVGEDAAIAFEEQCREVRRAVENRLSAYAGLLQGLRALHAAEGRLAGTANDYLAVLEWPRRFPALQRVQFHTGAPPHHERGSLLPGGVPAGDDDAAWLDQVAPGQGTAESGMAVANLPGAAHEGGQLLMLAVDLAAREGQVQGKGSGPGPGRVEAGRMNIAHMDVGRVGLALSVPRLVAEAVPEGILRQLRLQMALAAPAGGTPPFFDSMDTVVPAGLQRETVGPRPPVLSSRGQVRIDGHAVALQCSAVAASYLHPLVQVQPVLALAAGVVASLLLFGVLQAMGGARRRLQRAVADRTRDLQTVNRELREEVQERNRLEQAVFHFNVEERRRFAAELREGIALRLEKVLQRLAALETSLPPADALQEQVRALAGHVQTSLDQGRMLGLGLRPPAVSGAQFIPALRQLAAEAGTAFGMRCEFTHDGGPVPGDDMLLHNLYRIVQQAVTNAVTHGHARSVAIGLHTRGPLRLVVTDDGVGWTAAPDGASQGIGLSIMRYRCAVLDLGFRMEAGPGGKGAAIIVEARGGG